ncbi:MAG: hypothetical protein U0S12_02460 [Fimbriimonadales bacterium]
MTNSTFIARRKGGYTQISNDFLRDPNISLKAKGLLALLLSHSAAWNLNCQWTIQNHIKEGEASFYTTLRELKILGYVKHSMKRDDHGRVSHHTYEYSDSPIYLLDENQDVDKCGNKNTNNKNTKRFTKCNPGKEAVHSEGCQELKPGHDGTLRPSTYRMGEGDGKVVWVFDPNTRRTENSGARKGEGRYETLSKELLPDGRLVLYSKLKKREDVKRVLKGVGEEEESAPIDSSLLPHTHIEGECADDGL